MFAHASSCRSAWVKSPRKRRGRCFTTARAVGVVERRKKGKKPGSLLKGARKALPLDYKIFPF